MNAPQLTVAPEDLDWFLRRASELSWRFASSMPTVPHSYVVRGRTWTDEEHLRAFGVLRTFGEPGKFHDRTQIYLHDPATNQRWWPMTRHYLKTKIINMASDGKMYGKQDALSTKNEWFAPYDAVAAYYDDIYLATEKSDRLAMWKAVEVALPGRKPKTLDLGAGTGGTLDARLAGAPDTTAVDISQGMLNDLVMKHPRIGAVFPVSAEEFLSWETGQNFELVMASFGSASYLSPEAVLELPRVCTGAVILSFYRQGFKPGQYRALRRGEPVMEMPDHTEAIEAARSLGGREEEQGNYVVFTIRGAA